MIPRSGVEAHTDGGGDVVLRCLGCSGERVLRVYPEATFRRECAIFRELHAHHVAPEDRTEPIPLVEDEPTGRVR